MADGTGKELKWANKIIEVKIKKTGRAHHGVFQSFFAITPSTIA
ncbi:hypothetical protein PPM_0112 [Paenibacillus polymyxa M1]|nr:hypothetical protein PPM_0112 [Paenibacillus polymyxa M1]